MDLNRATIIWRATSDIEIKKIWESWTSVVNFNVATNRRYTNSEWNKVEESEFHRCVAFGALADIIWNYVTKGKRLYVEWRLRTRKWEDTNWNTRYSTEIVCENIILLDWKSSDTNKSAQLQDNVNSSQQDEDEELPF